MNITGRAQENGEYVRRLLTERQPDFAAVLESVGRELACPMCPGPGCFAVPGGRAARAEGGLRS
jgi:hypothetical protein